MKKTNITLLMMLIVLTSFVSATITGLCYQETANVSTTCGGLSTGAYACSGTWDNTFKCSIAYNEDWGTAGIADLPGVAYLEVNYTKPLGVLNSSLWQYKYNDNYINYSISSGCWDQSLLQFKIISNVIGVGEGNSNFSCWNGTDWFYFANYAGGYDTAGIYEEAMWWNISVGIDNCSNYINEVLRITGKDEETDEDVNMTLNIFLEPTSSNGVNGSYELSGKINYTFCANKNFTIDAIMEYGDETIYTGRKYYLNDFQIDTSTTAEVILYHLNNSKASEIVFTVFDTTTGDRVQGAFIKILRFYPGENVFRTVEISKTDETGQTLGKMVLADVFYKFIIEAPAGTVKLDTDVLRILSLTRSFGISFVVDVLDTWNKIHSVSYSTTCTKGTKTCRITWSDESNIVQDVTLEVWRITGLSNKLLFKQTTAASSGTISYTVTEDTATNTYLAKGFIESNTGTSRYPGGTASFFYSDNPFFTDEAHRLASLFPLLLLVICIVFALVDWGVVGIVIGSLLGLIIGSMVGILPLSPFYFMSFIILGIILLYKLSK